MEVWNHNGFISFLRNYQMKQTRTLFSVFPFIFRLFRCSTFFIFYLVAKLFNSAVMEKPFA